jgi:Dolichyl-phosphate-mannose-protein mannosyltransferase
LLKGGPNDVPLYLRPEDPRADLTETSPTGLRAAMSPATPELAAGSSVKVLPAPGGRTGRAVKGNKPARHGGRSRRPYPAAALLPLILIVQACLSLHLVWSNTAFTDEALYLRSGHLEIEHWLFGTPIPAFPTYFSGSPVIYPPLGALADSIGGLAGARILSLVFMLVASSLLWATTNRLLGGRAAFFATALFAVLGPTIRLGAFATYDAMSLCLIALAAWCAVRAGEHRRASGWLAGAALALALANAAKYASGLFDPVVIGILIFQAAQLSTWKHALARGMTLAGYAVGLLIFVLALGGSEYITGIKQTTLTRAISTSPASLVFNSAWQLTAVVVVMAALGAVLVLLDSQPQSRRLLLIFLASAALLVPLEQARIHTMTSLTKHVDFGAWFAAVAAGYAVEVIIRWAHFRILRWVVTAVCLTLLAPAALLGLAQAQAIFRTWPNSAALMAKLRHLLPDTSGPILDDYDRAVAEYYLPREGAEWYRWSNNSSLRLLDGKSISVPVGDTLSSRLYANRIRAGYFSVVILGFSTAAALDYQILPTLVANQHYHLVAKVPYGGHESKIWEYEPQKWFKAEQLGVRVRVGDSPLGGLLTPAARLRPILGTISDIVSSTGIAAFLFTITVRFAWRRRKASDEA